MEKNINVPLQALYYLSVIFVLKDSPSSWTRLQSRCELSGGNCDSKQAVVMCVSSADNCLHQHLEIHTYQSISSGPALFSPAFPLAPPASHLLLPFESIQMLPTRICWDQPGFWAPAHTNKHKKRGVPGLSQSMGGVAAGQLLAFNYPLSLSPTPKNWLALGGLRSGDNTWGCHAPSDWLLPLDFQVLQQIKAALAVSAQGLLASGLLVERCWGGTGQGQCCGHVCILSSPFPVPAGPWLNLGWFLVLLLLQTTLCRTD